MKKPTSKPSDKYVVEYFLKKNGVIIKETEVKGFKDDEYVRMYNFARSLKLDKRLIQAIEIVSQKRQKIEVPILIEI